MNFYKRTFADFKGCSTPKRRPDQESISGSKYWFGKDDKGAYVVRRADHWGKVSSCYWLLDGSPDNYPSEKTGIAYISDTKQYVRPVSKEAEELLNETAELISRLTPLPTSSPSSTSPA